MAEESALRRLWTEVRELHLGSSGEIERLDSPPSPLEFLRNYISANKPCIISPSATSHWPAISHSLWLDNNYLPQTLISQSVSLHLTPHGRADSLVPLPKSPSDSDPNPHLLCFANPCVQKLPFPEALRIISSPTSSSSFVAYLQQQNDCFREEYSDLAADVDPDFPWASEAFGSKPDAVNLWIGNSLSQTSFHKDHYENLYVVITGEKHFLLLPPTDLHRLYVRRYPAARYIFSPEKGGLILEMEKPEREVPWCSVDPFPLSVEGMERQRDSFPLYFDGPKPFECTIKAGEILYLPSMWFHHVRQTPDCNGRTIAINYCINCSVDSLMETEKQMEVIVETNAHNDQSSIFSLVCRTHGGTVVTGLAIEDIDETDILNPHISLPLCSIPIRNYQERKAKRHRFYLAGDYELLAHRPPLHRR